MKKKVMLAVLTACLMFSAAACSNQANDDTAGETQNTADGEESQETEEFQWKMWINILKSETIRD